MRLLMIILFLLMSTITYADNSTSPIITFVSFSMPKESLKQWLGEAKQIHAPVIIRGLIDNSFKETINQMSQLINDNQNGVQLDPTLFKKFNIDKVPALVVRENNTCLATQSCIDKYDVIYGDVSMEYALNKIILKNDDLSNIAQNALQTLRDKKHV